MRLVRQRGSALFYALIIVTLVTAASMTAFAYARNSNRASTTQVTRSRLRGAAETGMADAIQQVWTAYLLSKGSPPGTTLGNSKNCADYITWLQGTADGTGTNGMKTAWSPATTYYTNATSSVLANSTAPVPGTGLPVTAAGIGKANVVVSMNWTPFPATGTPKSVTMLVNATAYSSGYNGSGSGVVGGGNVINDTVTLSATYSIGTKPWPGLQFGLLSNNINCIMCHSAFDNVARVYRIGGLSASQYPRVRVASLEQLEVRTGNGGNLDCATSIAGSLYTFGNVYSATNGTQLTYGTGAGGLSSNGGWDQNTGPDIQFYQIDPTTGNILENAGAPYLVAQTPGTGGNFNPWTTPPTTTPTTANQNLYLNYPSTGNQADGEVPTSFPSIVPDTNGNKYVDDVEWAASVATATGALTAPGLSVANGNVVPFGSATTLGAASNATFPSPGTTYGPAVTSGTSAGNNYILIGTPAAPIVINGTVAFGGDVVLMGVIQGTGQILVRGNLYIPQDLVYNDPGFGTAGRSFGNNGANTVAYAAGGNVMIGNYAGVNSDGTAPYWATYGGTPTPGGFTIPPTTTSGGSGTYFNPGTIGSTPQNAFTPAEMATFNRGEWAKTQKQVVSYKAGGGGALVSNLPANGGTYEAGYVPRFYTQSDVQVYIAADLNGQGNVTGTGNTTTGWGWNTATNSWKSNGAGSSADIPVFDSGSVGVSILNPTYVPSVTNATPAPLDASSPTVQPAILSISPSSFTPVANSSTPMTAYSTASSTASHTGATQWIPEQNLYNLTQNGLQSGNRVVTGLAGKPFEIDGLVYTNNSIFSIAKGGDDTKGKLTVNGSLIAADTGILAAGHGNSNTTGTDFQLNFDVNTSKYINIADPTHVGMSIGYLVER